MSISVLNTDAGLSGKTIVNLEDAQTVTGLKTYDRDPNAPFAVSSGSAVVTNLDADKVDGKHSTDLLLLDGTQSMSAALNLGSTGQIVFPATQNASSDANTLDDYEEGSWTPTLTFATPGNLNVVYATRLGWYTKVGRKLTMSFEILLSTFTHTTASGGLRITSDFAFTLPTNGNFVGALYFSGITKAGYTNYVVRANQSIGASTLDFVASGSGVNATTVTATDTPSGGTLQLVGTIVFFVA